MAKETLVGMLWYDTGELGERLKRAGEYYVDGEYGIEVEGAGNVLPFHLLIGHDDDHTAD